MYITFVHYSYMCRCVCVCMCLCMCAHSNRTFTNFRHITISPLGNEFQTITMQCQTSIDIMRLRAIHGTEYIINIVLTIRLCTCKEFIEETNYSE